MRFLHRESAAAEPVERRSTVRITGRYFAAGEFCRSFAIIPPWFASAERGHSPSNPTGSRINSTRESDRISSYTFHARLAGASHTFMSGKHPVDFKIRLKQ